MLYSVRENLMLGTSTYVSGERMDLACISRCCCYTVSRSTVCPFHCINRWQRPISGFEMQTSSLRALCSALDDAVSLHRGSAPGPRYIFLMCITTEIRSTFDTPVTRKKTYCSLCPGESNAFCPLPPASDS